MGGLRWEGGEVGLLSLKSSHLFPFCVPCLKNNRFVTTGAGNSETGGKGGRSSEERSIRSIIPSKTKAGRERLEEKERRKKQHDVG